MCCKQRTYGQSKPFRCNTYKKPGDARPILATQLGVTTLSASLSHGSRNTVQRVTQRVTQFAFSPHSPNNEPAAKPCIYPDSVGMDEAFAFRVFEFRFSLTEVPPCLKPSSFLPSVLPSAARIKVRCAPRAPTISRLSPSRKPWHASPASTPKKLTT